MRTRADRIRHTLLFEIFLISLTVLCLPRLLGVPAHTFGLLSVAMSTTAMIWNYLYNLGFDKLLLRLGRPLAPRPFWMRATHAIAFEIGFAFVSVPMIMYALGYGLVEAILLDAVYLVLVPVYAFLFNLLYDTVFPMPCDDGLLTAKAE